MIKVGILTFHNANNYGAVYQAFALSKYLSEKVDCEVIDYRCAAIENNTTSARYYIKYPNLVGWLASKLLKQSFERRNLLFDVFRTRYIPTSKKVYDINSKLDTVNQEYDKVIVGSDQVWNVLLTDYDKKYFLDFIDDNSKKYTYAASIGSIDALDSVKDTYENLLRSFKKISVRESNAQKWLKDSFNIPSNVHIDPVFLLEKKEWERLKQDVALEDYILFFVNGKVDSNTDAFVKVLSRQSGCEIYFMANEDRFYKYPNLHHLNEIAPEKLIGIIEKASYIVTDSFHITALSIIFHKQFFYYGNGCFNTRILNLLQILGLNDRIIDGKDALDRKEIDWKYVEEIICHKREEAYLYLDDILGD